MSVTSWSLISIAGPNNIGTETIRVERQSNLAERCRTLRLPSVPKSGKTGFMGAAMRWQAGYLDYAVGTMDCTLFIFI